MRSPEVTELAIRITAASGGRAAGATPAAARPCRRGPGASQPARSSHRPLGSLGQPGPVMPRPRLRRGSTGPAASGGNVAAEVAPARQPHSVAQ